ncbi:DUF1461 domain-containing protein [Natranaerobius thermophilus]|uniref:Integral membrane protein TIGR01906 n=1 Tax=Natranaerobius thermophilus (strain ATCC BAA-1301 / DSM 18059 / JW/NM-WN-LF) TaxID=457570 RepID=B2A0P7_NATTJ|nr:DUF1461 domain-containing protein [Natranaerobius thermophilus]ACB85927.1 integral membrane protein TIGR01906 [Natranaerobius thermophilus JW/NM-WN-LF]
MNTSNYNKKFIKCLLNGLIGILLLGGVFFANFAMVVFDFSHYEQQFEELDRVEFTGIEQAELYRVTEEILDYLKLQRSHIDITAEIEGEEERLFTERELIHMEDVRDLFKGGYVILVGNIFLLILGFYFGSSYLTYYHGQYLNSRREATAYLLKWGARLALALFLLLAVIFFLGFDFWYDQLHIWLFDNDYWLLNPETHNLIRIFPVPFFYNTIFRIVYRTVAHLAILLLISWTIPRIPVNPLNKG